MTNVPASVSAAMAVLALVFAVFSWWQANQSTMAKEAAQLARDSAREQLEQQRELVSATRGAPWQLRREGKFTVALINRTGHPVKDVLVERTGISQEPQIERIGPDSEARIDFMPPLGPSDFDWTIAVTWTDQNDDRRDVTLSIPEQP